MVKKIFYCLLFLAIVGNVITGFALKEAKEEAMGYRRQLLALCDCVGLSYPANTPHGEVEKYGECETFTPQLSVFHGWGFPMGAVTLADQIGQNYYTVYKGGRVEVRNAQKELTQIAFWGSNPYWDGVGQ